MDDIVAVHAGTDCANAMTGSPEQVPISSRTSRAPRGSRKRNAADDAPAGPSPAERSPEPEAPAPREVCDGAESGPHAPAAGTCHGQLAPERRIEALLFASDAPLSAARLAELAEVGSVTQVRLHLAALNDQYTLAGLSFRVCEIARGYQLMTLPQYQTWIARLNQHQANVRLSAAAMETLAIVAYKQPVVRAEIEAIRGAASGDVLNRLREAGLVKCVGRAEVLGRPMMYATTRHFLDVFGLADLKDLPALDDFGIRPPAATPDAPLTPQTPAAPAQDVRSESDLPPPRLAAAGA